jgi:hypothetical protein
MLEYYNVSRARWANVELELSYQTPPVSPPLDTNLGTIAGPHEPFSINTTGDFDTEIAVYSETGAVIAKNDDAASAPIPTVLSAINFDIGLPAGNYIAALGGFNTTFANGYSITPGSVAGNYGLHLANASTEGVLSAGQFAFVGFSIGTDNSLLGDFDGNGQLAPTDIDMLTAEIFAGTNDPAIDVTGDGMVDAVDLTKWMADAALHNGFAQTYLSGDSNLDGSVDAKDLNSLALHWQQANTPMWSRGDFNVDGIIDAADLNVLALNWQQSIPMATVASAAVPEPSAWLISVVVVGLVLVSRLPVSIDQKG